MHFLTIAQLVGTAFGVVFIVMRGEASWRFLKWYRRDRNLRIVRSEISTLLLASALDSGVIVATVIFFMFLSTYRAVRLPEILISTALDVWVFIGTWFYLTLSWRLGPRYTDKRIYTEAAIRILLSIALAAMLVYWSKRA